MTKTKMINNAAVAKNNFVNHNKNHDFSASYLGFDVL